MPFFHHHFCKIARIKSDLRSKDAVTEKRVARLLFVIEVFEKIAVIKIVIDMLHTISIPQK